MSKKLPEGWRAYKLKECVTFLDGLRKPIKEQDRIPGPYPYYGANGIQGSINSYIFDEDLVLLAEDGGHFGSKEKPIAYMIQGKTWVNNHAHVLRANKQIVSTKYLCKCLSFYDVRKYVTGSTRLKLTKGQAENIVLQIPPLEEQERIVHILEKAESAIEKREKSIKLLDELVKSRFIELFKLTDFDEKELTYFIKEGAGLSYGIVVPGDNCQDGIPMIRPTDYENDKIKLDNLYRVDRSIEVKYAKTRLEGNEILVTVIGSNMGQIMLTDSRCIGMNVTRNLAVIRQDDNKINKHYLREFLLSEKSQNYLRGQVNTSTIKQLPLNKLKQMMIPNPPIELQNEFAELVNQADKLKFEMENSLKELKNNFNSLMQKAFNGEL